MFIYEESQAIACGAIKEFDSSTMEIKRMFTQPSYRKKGYAVRVLNMHKLSRTSMQKTRCVLETGKHQAEALRLYLAHGQTMIPNYEPYISIENSIYLEKNLVPKNKIDKQNPSHYKTNLL
ncbi:MAG: GNAT family N-acetyltransferase [Flavobacteriaceae bacterium]|nr:GNAT family N-acetyltransferase [Flavobacteriaceae bacterium]